MTIEPDYAELWSAAIALRARLGDCVAEVDAHTPAQHRMLRDVTDTLDQVEDGVLARLAVFDAAWSGVVVERFATRLRSAVYDGAGLDLDRHVLLAEFEVMLRWTRERELQ